MSLMKKVKHKIKLLVAFKNAIEFVEYENHIQDQIFIDALRFINDEDEQEYLNSGLTGIEFYTKKNSNG